MNAATRLLAFGAALGLAFCAASLAGAAVDPSGSAAPAEGRHDREVTHGAARGGENAGAHGGAHESGGSPAAGGLAVSDGGYALEAERTFFPAGPLERFSFRIRDGRGRVVRTGYELEAEREMHLIVVRRDTATYEHLHPRRDVEGRWSTDLVLPEPGVYRAYADFKVEGRQRVLATDLFVAGDFRPKPLPAPTSSDSTGGFDVALDTASRARGGRASSA